jgi:hypothetical protein
MYFRVPAFSRGIVCRPVGESALTMNETPKSMIFGSPSELTRMLEGLRS